MTLARVSHIALLDPIVTRTHPRGIALAAPSSGPSLERVQIAHFNEIVLKRNRMQIISQPSETERVGFSEPKPHADIRTPASLSTIPGPIDWCGRYLIQAHHFYHPCFQMEDLLIPGSHPALVERCPVHYICFQRLIHLVHQPIGNSLRMDEKVRRLSTETQRSRDRGISERWEANLQDNCRRYTVTQ